MENRGILYPERLPSFHRMAATEDVAVWVRWFWIPEWDLPEGRVHRQQIIGYPACNLVVESDLVGISGPTTRASYRDLTGTGWAVGALLRPAAIPGLVGDPRAVRDDYRLRYRAGRGTGQALVPAVRKSGDSLSARCPTDLPELHRSMSAAMESADPALRHEQAVTAFSDWIREQLTVPTDEALLANAMVDLIDAAPDLTQVGDTADALGVSVRTLQRLARTYVGLTPAAMIRRRRLQHAAEQIREHPGTDLADLAAELGYADHAHLTREFRSILGFTPTGYRDSSHP